MEMILVEWIDSSASGAWTYKSELTDNIGAKILTVGFLERKNKNGIRVASNDGDYAVGCYTEIPAECIIKITKLKKQKRKKK